MQKLQLGLGRTALVRGRLVNRDGQPISGATVYVLSSSTGIAESVVGLARTNGSGRFSYRLRASRSRTLRFMYTGTELALPAQGSVHISVPAASTFRATRHRVRNGGAVGFRGRVLSQPVPAAGKIVEIQAHFRGRWRTFSTVRSDRRGKWRFRYRFGGTRRTTRYRFRALLPSEAGYPFAAGRSRVVRVTVIGA